MREYARFLTCSYDIILGRDFLRKVQFNINFENNTMNCMDMSVPMRLPDFFYDRACLRDIMFFNNVKVDAFALTITKSTYHPVSISATIDTQTHLSVEDRNTLSIMLNKHAIFFDGILKVYPHRLVHLDIQPNVTPWHLHAYLVAHIHLDVFKAELVCLCKIGVLEICGASQWASPMFIISKRDGSVCWVSNFRELNNLIQHCIYPLPCIQDILRCHPGYSFFLKIDLSMQYFTFELDTESQKLCVISTPIGLCGSHISCSIKSVL